MHYVTYCLAGIFVLDEDKRIVDKSLFPKDPKEILEKINDLKKGKEISELKEVLKKIEDKNLVTDIPLKSEKFNIQEIKIDKDPRKLSIESCFVKNNKEFNKILSKIQILKTKGKINSSEKMDKVVMQVVSAIDDLTDISNRFSERLHEWYGLYYPELEKKIKNNKSYAKEISENPKRDLSQESIGMKLGKDDLDILKKYAKETKDIFELQEYLEDYLEDLMEKVAKNVKAITGAKLGAKLILLAGGLEKLAKLPSSTVQLLGAEKALFRFMKSKKKSKPPKYGVIYLHPEVTNAPDHLKGKVARAIASEISIAVKTDFYTNKDKTEKYKENVKERIKEIYEKD